MSNQIKEAIKKNIFPILRGVTPYLKESSYYQTRLILSFSIVLIIQIVFTVNLLGYVRAAASRLAYLNNRTRLLDDKIKSAEKNIQTIKKNPQATESIVQSLPYAKDSYSLLEKLNGTAGDTQVTLLDISFSKEKTSITPELLEQPAELVIQGRFENVFTFIDRLNTYQRPLLVDSLALSTSGNSFGTGIIKAEINLRLFSVTSN